ncbi:hypothetical protein CDD80_5237 [Ophiocordyceps camponoti-rufipedis]|uniref:Uncharacterized protein n=1 Tax=Ophiocordyceps camponoti-rufipedis TaxID=2004952 RepID=A0A2C5YVY6_9HYPO|nr:hypothetical protein CDD80_5237 [Ophiocordyceps camponoti-rufipedis]
MPLAHVVIAPGVVIAVSVTMAVAMALYGSPELRRVADDARRRIAMAVHSFGDGIDPYRRNEPRFNRPEDADGFMLSSRDPGFAADDETLRRQREELLYWNRMRMEQSRDQEATAKEGERVIRSATQDSSRPDVPLAHGSGADALPATSGLRHRGEPPNPALYYANPFADEHAASDIYSATTRDAHDDFHSAPLAPSPPSLIDLPAATDPVSPSDEHRQEAYASIQAWARDSSNHGPFTAPGNGTVLPASESDGELVSDGRLTPTATEVSAPSLAGSGERVVREEEAVRPFDVLSESDGMDTPLSWSDMGSVVSESETLGRV